MGRLHDWRTGLPSALITGKPYPRTPSDLLRLHEPRWFHC